MKVAVLYESRTGNTQRAAEMIGAAVEELGHEVGVWPSSKANLDFLTDVDLVFVGTWCDGIIIGGHRPGDAGRLFKMPGIWGKPTAGFVTYALHCGKVVRGLADVVIAASNNQRPSAILGGSVQTPLDDVDIDNNTNAEAIIILVTLDAMVLSPGPCKPHCLTGIIDSLAASCNRK